MQAGRSGGGHSAAGAGAVHERIKHLHRPLKHRGVRRRLLALLPTRDTNARDGGTASHCQCECVCVCASMCVAETASKAR